MVGPNALRVHHVVEITVCGSGALQRLHRAVQVLRLQRHVRAEFGKRPLVAFQVHRLVRAIAKGLSARLGVRTPEAFKRWTELTPQLAIFGRSEQAETDSEV